MPSVDEVRQRAGEVVGDISGRAKDVTDHALERLRQMGDRLADLLPARHGCGPDVRQPGRGRGPAGVPGPRRRLMSVGFAVWAGEGADFEEQVAGTGMAAVVLLCIWLYFGNLFLLLGYFIASEHHRGDGSSARA